MSTFTWGESDATRRLEAVAASRRTASAEYTVGLWTLRSPWFEGGLHAIAFLDAGRAWQDDADRWNIGRQRIADDGGFGLGTAEDNLRVYAARNLHESGSSFVWSARLRRPF